MIEIYTRLWPEPGPRTEVIQDSRSPTGIIEIPVHETERRKNHIDLIDPTHALLPIALDCLRFQEVERPSSEELCQRLADLKESTEYQESMDLHQDEAKSKDDLISELTQQLQEKDRLLREIDEETLLTREKFQFKSKESEILAEKDRILQAKETQHQVELAFLEIQLEQLNQQLEEQEQVTAEIQHSLQRQVEQLQQQLVQQDQGSRQPSSTPYLEVDGDAALQDEDAQPEHLHTQADQNLHPPKKSVKILEWRDGGKSPFRVVKGAAVVDENVAYFMGWNGKVCSYNSTSRQWTKLPTYPYGHK